MSKGTPKRSIRIEDGLWNEAQLLAREADDNLSEVIREALTEYVIAHRDNPYRSQT
jgi:hypothetical protein